jgi:hypothetical protein
MEKKNLNRLIIGINEGNNQKKWAFKYLKNIKYKVVSNGTI